MCSEYLKYATEAVEMVNYSYVNSSENVKNRIINDYIVYIDVNIFCHLQSCASFSLLLSSSFSLARFATSFVNVRLASSNCIEMGQLNPTSSSTL